MLECVVNVSEGRNLDVLNGLAATTGDTLLDVHRDPHHHRSVFSLVGTASIRQLTEAAVARLDLREHQGVHPRLGVVDVVPFVPLAGATMGDALAARHAFGEWAASMLGVPCFFYGPERTLPEVRRRAFRDLAPSLGPATPHPSAGAICVGARTELVAFNVYLRSSSLDEAKRVASRIRGPHLRTLGLAVGNEVQVSMNLVSPRLIGPAQAYDLVARHAEVDRAELVGLVPAGVLAAIPRWRWQELDLAEDRTVEWRLQHPLGSREPRVR